MKVRLWQFVAAIALGGTGPATGAEIPADVKAALEQAGEWELYSLHPEQKKDAPKEAFHNWRVLGKTTVKDADTRKKLLDALANGAKDNDGKVADCFNPRHGIRVKTGDKTIDLVICFECYQTEIYVADKKAGGYNTERSPQPALDKVLTDAKVPLPKDR